METASVMRVRMLSLITGLVGFVGICSGIQINSIVWFCVAAAMWGVAAKCIDRIWVFGAAGEFIMQGRSVWGRVQQDCYIVRACLPKNYFFFRPKPNTGVALSTDLFVRAAFGEGYIVRISIVVDASMGESFEAIGSYYEYFVRMKQSKDEYLVHKLKAFQQQEEDGAGLLGAAHRYEVGKTTWIRSFMQSLHDHFERELAPVGLRVGEIKVTYGNHAKSLFIQGGRVL